MPPRSNSVPRPGLRPAARPRFGAALVALTVWGATLAGCNDSATCVFTTGCQGGAGPGAAGNPATLPQDGFFVLPGLPTVEAVFPSADTVAETTPILIVFSESMSDDVGANIAIAQLDVAGFPLPIPIPFTTALAAGNRVLVVLPTVLPQGDGFTTSNDFIVQVASGGVLLDATGQDSGLAGGAQLSSFSIDVTAPTDPEVVGVYPSGALGANGGSPVDTTTPLIVLFDRDIDPAEIDDASFEVLVNGADPTFDPLAQPLSISTQFGPVTDQRVYVWREVDAQGDPVSLGTGATVDVTLSRSPDTITDAGGGILPETNLSFSTLGIEAPTSSAITSTPTDAIGIANLTPGVPGVELFVGVGLDDGLAGDVLTVTMFGNTTTDPPQLMALSRTRTLAGAGSITSDGFTLAELDLTSSLAPVTGRFGDGPISFGFQLTRGLETTPMQVLDVDPTTPGIQDPVQDTVAPTLDELLFPGGGVVDEFRSDHRDLVIVGRASEAVSSVEVSTPLGGNGTLPPVVGVDEDGLFIAAPAPLGIVAGGTTTYDLVLYDQALNASPQVSGTFTQLGVSGPNPLVGGSPIAVEVFDAVTLAPLVGARVFTHGDMGDMTNFPLEEAALTDAAGLASVDSAPGPAISTILTVEADGYDLFSWHGIAVDAISIPLRPSNPGTASTDGALGTSSAIAAITLDLLDRKLDDSRRPLDAQPTFADLGCSVTFGGVACTYGPEPIEPNRLGAQSFLAGTHNLTQGAFSAALLLQAFDLVIPQAPTVGGDTDTTAIDLPFVLTEPGIDPTELPVEIPPLTLNTNLTMGVDTANLVGDPTTTGDPFISVEALVPGVPGAVTVGLGLAFDQGGGVYDLRTAIPGAVTPAGFFAPRIDTDLLVRAEIRDTAGNRAGQRPRSTALPALPVPSTLFPASVPTISSPSSGASTGPSYNVVFANGIPDAGMAPGLYLVRAIDSAGRRWTLLREDPPDGFVPFVHLPDIGSDGGVPLADGAVTLTVEAYGWPGFDVLSFLFSDIEREHDFFSETAPLGVVQS